MSASSIALVAVHDDYLIVTVKLVRQLLSKRLNTVLKEGLLCIDIQSTVALVSILGEGDCPFFKAFELHKVFLGQIAELHRELLLQS